MAQPQHQMSPAQSYSPAQPSPTPSLSLPPSKRPRMSPGPGSQPASPFPAQQQLPQQQQQQYASLVSTATPPPPTNPAASPQFHNMVPHPPQQAQQPQQLQQAQYQNTQYQNSPYQNGNTTPTLHLPNAQPQVYQSAPTTPITPLAPATPQPQQQMMQPQMPQQMQPQLQPQMQQPMQQQMHQQYTPAILAPMGAPPTPAPVTPGIMGPPSKPAERPVRENDNHDPIDSLAGTGVDLRAEEQALTEYYAGNFGQDARYGFPANAPGGRGSMYGAGLANQAGQPVDGQTQKEVEIALAEKAWNEAAQNLAIQRSIELKNAFLDIALLHRKASKISQHYDINLNVDLKNSAQQILGKMKPPEGWNTEPQIKVTTKTGPEGSLVETTGSWIPHDAYLVDQLALLSIATKHRIREKIEDAFHVASVRQKTAHGDVPQEWIDVAAPMATATASETQDALQGSGGASAGSPRTNPLKRPLEPSTGNATTTASTGTAKALGGVSTNHLTSAVREHGKGDRDAEEARLRKRAKRANPETATAASRAGSVAPGSPAGEPDRTLSKKELKELKKAAGPKGRKGDVSDAQSTAAANQTLSQIMTFGNKKKANKYAWMNAGGASGASTPGRLTTTGLPGTPAAAIAKAPERTRLTAEGKNRFGAWREDGDKGKKIQMRDWVTVMEIDGIDLKAIQDSYVKLDETIADKQTNMAT